MHHAVNALGDAPATLVPFPGGSGNDFCRGLGLDGDPETTARALRSGVTRPRGSARGERPSRLHGRGHRHRRGHGRPDGAADGAGVGVASAVAIARRLCVHGRGSAQAPAGGARHGARDSALARDVRRLVRGDVGSARSVPRQPCHARRGIAAARARPERRWPDRGGAVAREPACAPAARPRAAAVWPAAARRTDRRETRRGGRDRMAGRQRARSAMAKTSGASITFASARCLARCRSSRSDATPQIYFRWPS